jgi:hypothetical protein
MTNNRLTQGGKTLLMVVSAAVPSALVKSVQLAFVIMSCRVGFLTFKYSLTQRTDDTG